MFSLKGEVFDENVKTRLKRVKDTELSKYKGRQSQFMRMGDYFSEEGRQFYYSICADAAVEILQKMVVCLSNRLKCISCRQRVIGRGWWVESARHVRRGSG